jgi:hypothetical protein
MIFTGMLLNGGLILEPILPPSSINYLIVGGGGGGGAGNQSFSGGGGGAGGKVSNTTLSGIYPGTSITVTVGAGGTSGLANGTTGTAGTSSSIAISGTTSALPGQYGYNFATGGNPWGGTSGSGNRGGYGYANGGYGSSGGGDATVGFDYNDATYPCGGGWGTLVSAFNMYGTDVNNIVTNFTLTGVQLIYPEDLGQFGCYSGSSQFAVGMAVTISGTLSGDASITGYTNPTTYYMINNDYGDGPSTKGTTRFQLSATPGGDPIDTVNGTLTGLTFTVLVSATKGYFGGGGGGGQWWAFGAGAAGRGGGGLAPNGQSVPTQTGQPGVQNTGGGGGGGGSGHNSTGTSVPGGAGGSGIVIISYPEGCAVPSTTGSPTLTTSGGYVIYAFTSSGSLTF